MLYIHHSKESYTDDKKSVKTYTFCTARSAAAEQCVTHLHRREIRGIYFVFAVCRIRRDNIPSALTFNYCFP